MKVIQLFFSASEGVISRVISIYLDVEYANLQEIQLTK